MDNRRKIVRIINLLIMFLIILFLGFGENIVGITMLIAFLFFNTVRLVVKKSKTMEHFSERTYLFSFVIIILFLILGVRLGQIQIVKYEKFHNLSEGQTYGEYSLTGKRGKILDSTGRELAYNVGIYKVILDPLRFYKLEEKNEIIKELEEIHPITARDFKDKLKENFENKKRYMIVMKKVDELQKEKIDKLKSKYHMRNNEIYFERSTERKYYFL